MFLKSKKGLFAFLFASLIVSACTKDEESLKAPVATEATAHDAAVSHDEAMAAEAAKNFTPIHFAFDSSAIDDSYHGQIVNMSEFLKNGSATVQIAGHTDARGTTQYNLALGSRRADAVKGMMVQMGVAESKITTVSYGKEQPVDTGSNEEAWKKNRRAEFQLAK